jgi:hypothetical protein
MNKLSSFDNIRQNILKRQPSAFLLAAQFLLLILYAVFDGREGHRLVISIFGLVALLMVLWVVTSRTRAHWIAWSIAVPAFLLSLVALVYDVTTLRALASLFEALLYFYTAGTLIAYMLKDYEVTTDELFAVGATFTLLAWGFAHAYYVSLVLAPGSIINLSIPGRVPTFLELLFLSFTNLSATGLGDIMPVAAMPRVLAMIEQFAGVGYVAMVVSRLIGLMSRRRSQQKEKRKSINMDIEDS